MELRKEMLSVLRPLGGDEEVEAIRESIESGWWTRGPKVEQFEKEFAKLVGSKYAVAVTSNSHGQDLVMKALGMRNIDVINPTISFMATAIVPIWNDCTSNIVDVRRHDLNLDPEDVKKSLKKNTEVVLAVNMAGIPAPIDEIREFYDGYIIEDCAHSCYVPGAGTKGDIAIWSFQAVKTMPIGDGGMITTNDYDLYKKLQSLAWFGIESTYSRLSGKSDTGGNNIKCAEYATFGTKELSQNIIKALEGRKACLMSNHGQVAFGKSLSEAFELAEEIENICHQYINTIKLGNPKILSDEEMKKILDKTKNYKRN